MGSMLSMLLNFNSVDNQYRKAINRGSDFYDSGYGPLQLTRVKLRRISLK